MIRQVVVLLADGARPDVLQLLHEAGRVPAISRLLIEPSGGRVRVASSVLPSTTGPAHLPFLTGRFPGPCNVPGIRWLDPHAYRRHWVSADRYRSYMGPGSLRYDRDLSPDVRTLYELVPEHASAGSHIRRGLRPGGNLTRWSKLWGSASSFLTEDWSALDLGCTERMVRAVAAGNRLVFGALYSADSSGHKHGPLHPHTLLAYELLDRAVARIGEALGDGLLLLCSDHGQSETHTHLDLAGLVERHCGLCLSHPLTWRGHWGAQAAVMVSGNAFAHVHLLDGDAPSFLDAPGPRLARLVDALLRAPAVDQVIGRSRDGGALLLTANGRARLHEDLGEIVCEVEGEAPLGLAAGRRDRDGWLAATWDGDYPDAPVQVLQLLTSPRSGDLLVTAKPGFDLRARFEKPPHRGSHGALHWQHMRTPLLASRPLRSGPARTADVMPTVLDALQVAVPEGLDGRSLWPC
jgi:predicted AlkP superfamily pyrophosphatase or phosphodiesterase